MKISISKNQLFLIGFGISLASCSPHKTEEIPSEENYVPKEGYVPNEETAIKIAEAVWLPIYGNSIEDEKPFKASLKDGVWYVESSLPTGMLGGVAYADIRKSTGKILRVIHSK